MKTEWREHKNHYNGHIVCAHIQYTGRVNLLIEFIKNTYRIYSICCEYKEMRVSYRIFARWWCIFSMLKCYLPFDGHNSDGGWWPGGWWTDSIRLFYIVIKKKVLIALYPEQGTGSKWNRVCAVRNVHTLNDSRVFQLELSNCGNRIWNNRWAMRIQFTTFIHYSKYWILRVGSFWIQWPGNQQMLALNILFNAYIYLWCCMLSGGFVCWESFVWSFGTFKYSFIIIEMKDK